MGAQPDPVEVLGVYAQKSAPANVVILGAGSFIWYGAQLQAFPCLSPAAAPAAHQPGRAPHTGSPLTTARA